MLAPCAQPPDSSSIIRVGSSLRASIDIGWSNCISTGRLSSLKSSHCTTHVRFRSRRMLSRISFSAHPGKRADSKGKSIHSITIEPTVITPISSHRSSHIFGGGLRQGRIMLNPASFASFISRMAISRLSGYASFVGYKPSKNVAFRYIGFPFR